MGSAPHMAAVPEPTRPKNGGGRGGADSYPDSVRRIYNDPRAGHEARELLLDGA